VPGDSVPEYLQVGTSAPKQGEELRRELKYFT